MNNSTSIDQRKLERMRREVSFLQSQQRGARRIKLEKGQTIVVRFLPARLGPDEMWYVRIAQHWLNKMPITCPRLTGDDMGGDPDAYCPVCAVADDLNDSPDEKLSQFGWSVKAGPQYMTYCLLFEKNDTKLGMSEVINPYEYRLNKSTWEELHGFYQAGLRKCPDSILDYVKGNDFSVIRTAKGTRLDKLDSLPIFDQDASFNANIEKIEAALKTPKVVIPTTEQLEVFADKVRDAASRIGHESAPAADSPRRGRRADEGEAGDAPRSRRAEADDDAGHAPRSRRAAPDPEDDPTPRSRRQEPESDQGDPRAGRRSAPAEAPAEAPAARRSVPAEAPAARRSAPAEAPASRRSRVDEDDNIPYDTPSRPSAGRAAAAPPEDADSDPGTSDGINDVDPETAPPVARPAAAPAGRLAPTPNRARAETAPAPAPSAPTQEDDEDALPEESRDAAPPAESLPPVTDDEGSTPPPVARRGSLDASIRGRLSGLGKSKA